MAINEDTLNALLGRFVETFGGAGFVSTVVIGDKLGLYQLLAAKGPCTAGELAGAAGLDARLVEEWCNAQYVNEWCEYDPATQRFSLTDEQAALLADESSPAFVAGASAVIAALYKDEERIREAFRTGNGVAWSDHCHDLFHGVERFFKPGYVANLATSWIPALDGVEQKLRGKGAQVADVGCGHGSSTILLATEYPGATITGFDSHEPSIAVARQRAEEAGVAGRVRFQVASAQDFPGSGYDLVCIFDALHDMGDPPGAARHIHETLAADGTWLLVEPMSSGNLEDRVNPVGRAFAAGSVGICTPAAQAQEGGYALGNQVADERWQELLGGVGFSRFRRATETPFNRVFEVRK